MKKQVISMLYKIKTELNISVRKNYLTVWGKGQIFEVDDLVQQGTVSHLSDEEVIIESDMNAYQISLEYFKEN